LTKKLLETLLLTQVFAYCSANPIYDSPNGEVVRFNEDVAMINITHTWLHHQRDPFRIQGWVEVFPTNTRGWIVDGEQSYWMRMDGCWGERVGV
jgi:hypothetical protein